MSRRTTSSPKPKLAEVKEVSDALNRYFTMRVLYLQAIHDFNMATARLARATGIEIAN